MKPPQSQTAPQQALQLAGQTNRRAAASLGVSGFGGIARATFRACMFLLLVLRPANAHAHIGSPNVFFDGAAGPFPVRITVRPPPVIPGLAEVHVRVLTNSTSVERVTALPIRWNTGREGAPPPDEALRVQGETNLHSAQLWLMQGGAQSVQVELTGAAGIGSVILPINATATRVLEMPRYLAGILSAAGILLFLLIVSIFGASVREAVLPPGEQPGSGRRWRARLVMLLACACLAGLVWFGNKWWQAEAADYRTNRLYRPMETGATVRMEDGARILQLELTDEGFRRNPPLVPDHGKLMHLFLVREPGLDALAHLHPRKVEWNRFETALPDLPAGDYRLYAEITYETGLSDTLTASVSLNPAAAPSALSPETKPDPEDSWRITEPLSPGTPSGSPREEPRVSELGEGYEMERLEPTDLAANQETTLRFAVRTPEGRPARIEPYMGMLAHLVLRRDDGAVFTHLHPSGTFSMAARQLFEMRADGRAPRKVARATEDPLCRLPTVEELTAQDTNEAADGIFSFPYAFPKEGLYRLWVQVRLAGSVRTGVFDVVARRAPDQIP